MSLLFISSLHISRAKGNIIEVHTLPVTKIVSIIILITCACAVRLYQPFFLPFLFSSWIMCKCKVKRYNFYKTLTSSYLCSNFRVSLPSPFGIVSLLYYDDDEMQTITTKLHEFIKMMMRMWDDMIQEYIIFKDDDALVCMEKNVKFLLNALIKLKYTKGKRLETCFCFFLTS